MEEKELVKKMNEVNNDLGILMKDYGRMTERFKKLGNKVYSLSVELANYCENNQEELTGKPINNDLIIAFEKIQKKLKKCELIK